MRGAIARPEKPVPRPRPGGRLDRLVRYARELRAMGFDVVEDPTTRMTVVEAVLVDLKARRGAPAMWRHARRVLVALERAFREDAREDRRSRRLWP
ncbi:MAG TPA: hypothetical protein VIL18_01145 [Longimicrobiales bacterium]